MLKIGPRVYILHWVCSYSTFDVWKTCVCVTIRLLTVHEKSTNFPHEIYVMAHKSTCANFKQMRKKNEEDAKPQPFDNVIIAKIPRGDIFVGYGTIAHIIIIRLFDLYISLAYRLTLSFHTTFTVSDLDWSE